MRQQQKLASYRTPVTAFTLSLIAGILMLISGIISTVWFMGRGYNSSSDYWGMMNSHGMMGGFGSMMDGYESMMHSFGVPFGMMGGLSIIGLIAGTLVIICALMLNMHPRDHITWGTIIVVFSVISLLGMGGFYLGALLGIAGGALALSWRPKRATQAAATSTT